jgi:hypothetical protein
VPTAPPATWVIRNELGVGMTSLNDDQPGEIIASSKSSMKASAIEVVRTRVPALAHTPMVGTPPLELVLPLELLTPLLPLLAGLPLLAVVGVVVVLLPPAPVPPVGSTVPEEHAEASAKPHADA